MAEGNILSFKKAKAGKTSKFEEMWGPQVSKLGHLQTPSLLLKAQRRLGLSSTQLVVLLQVMDHWWGKDSKAYPSKGLLSDKAGFTPRHVQRVIAKLEDRGFVRRIERYWPNGGKNSNEYDFAPLVRKLQKIAPDFIKIEEEAKEKRRAAIRKNDRGRAETTPK